MKKIVIIVIVISVLLQNTIPIRAYSDSEYRIANQSITDEIVLDYVESVLPYYAMIDKVDTNGLSITHPTKIFDLDGEVFSYAVFAITDSWNAQITVGEGNNGLFSSCSREDYVSDILELIEDTEEFVIIGGDNTLTLISGENVIALSGENEELTDVVCEKLYNSCEHYNDFKLVDINTNICPKSYIPPNTYHHTDAPVVANATNPYNNKGLCWLACMASISNHIQGTTYSTISLFNTLWNHYGRSYSDIPVGSTTWMNRCASFIGVSMSRTTSGVSADAVDSSIVNGKPVEIFISGHHGSDALSHAVLIVGLVSMGGYGFYYLMDPNKTSYVLVSVSSDTWADGSDFYYVPSSGYVYDSWNETWK